MLPLRRTSRAGVLDCCLRVGARMTSPMTAIPRAPAVKHAAAFSAVIPPSGDDRTAGRGDDACETIEAECRAVAGLARGEEDRAQR